MAGRRLLAPCTPGKVVALAINYEGATGQTDQPGEPLVFLKPASSVCGPEDDIVSPFPGLPVWGEAELAIVVGRLRQASALRFWPPFSDTLPPTTSPPKTSTGATITWPAPRRPIHSAHSAHGSTPDFAPAGRRIEWLPERRADPSAARTTIVAGRHCLAQLSADDRNRGTLCSLTAAGKIEALSPAAGDDYLVRIEWLSG